jgi:hypothetical protein
MNFWASLASVAAFPSLAAVPLQLLGMHMTSCASARNWSLWGYIYSKAHNCLSLERAVKLVYIKQNLPNTAVLSSDGAKPERQLSLQLLEDKQ